MTLTEGLLLLLAGLSLGFLFFGGLYLTVRGLPRRRSPRLWLFLSFLFRTSLVLALFGWLMEGSAARLLLLVVGFLMARFLSLRLFAP